MTPDALRAEVDAEAARSVRASRALRLVTFGYAGAYLYVAIGLGRLDLIYLWLTAVSMAASATQLVLVEAGRAPRCLERLAAQPLGPDEPEVTALRAACAALWPELRARYGQGIAALGPKLLDREELAAFTLEEAVGHLRGAPRRDWRAASRRALWGVGLLALGVPAALLLRS